jgi:hypothetical protein
MTERRVSVGALFYSIRARAVGALRKPKNLARLDRLDAAERAAATMGGSRRRMGTDSEEWKRIAKEATAQIEANRARLLRLRG